MLKTLDIGHRDIVATFVEETSRNGGAVMLERDGEPAAVVISPAAYQEYEELRLARFVALLDASASRFDHLTEEEIGALVDEDVEIVREELYRAGRLG